MVVGTGIDVWRIEAFLDWGIAFYCFKINFAEKQRRLKQAKEQAQDEIEKYRQERDRQFKEFEAKVC